jgi:hypothetical protein
MRSSLRLVTRFLFAFTLVSVVAPLCPCPDAMAMEMDDCCAPVELSISASCCTPAADPVVSVPSLATILFVAPPLIPAATSTEALVPVSARSQRTQSRPAVARTILRI